MKYLWVTFLMLPFYVYADKATTFDGFVDLYYAYDFNEPTNHDREYTTQPARHNEFNANLVMLGVEHQKDDLKARLSFQAGTYVQSNYAAEPLVGSISGGDLSRHIQDAFITYQVSDETSLIAGIFPSHIGYEHVLSINNYTYTRSLAADFSPYFNQESGFYISSMSLGVLRGM